MSERKEVEETFEEMESTRKQSLHAVLSFLIALGILAGMGAAVYFLTLTKPQAKKKEEVAATHPVVEVVVVERREGGVPITAEGVVESQRVVTLTAEVSGRIVEVSPNLVAGGRVRQGEVLARLDAADYLAAQEQAKAAVADAKLALDQESARRDQAIRDWKKLGKGEPSDLLARKPQIASAEARLNSASAEVARAARNLARTIIHAPFDSVVREKSVEIGAVLLPGAQLATLFSERNLEVELPLKLADYALIQRDGDGQVTGEVILRGGLGSRTIIWNARIVRTSGEVSRDSLTAGVIALIEPADGEGEFRLPPPGLFVEAELAGQSLRQVVAVPREAVRDGGNVAVVNDEDLLEYRKLQVVRTNDSEVFVAGGVAEGERVVLTRLSLVGEGAKVSVKPDEIEEGEE